jgi:hypothetical protein
MLRFQEEEDFAHSLRDPRAEFGSELFPSEIMAGRDVGGQGELAGSRQQGENGPLNTVSFIGIFVLPTVGRVASYG